MSGNETMNWRGRFPWLTLILLVVLLTLAGCAKQQSPYIPVSECKVPPPPKAERFINAGVDERLILMTSSYIASMRSLAQCNSDIKATNVANKAVSK